VIESRAGAGTFVLPPWPLAAHHAPPTPTDVWPAWQAGLAGRSNPEHNRMLSQVLRGSTRTDTVDLTCETTTGIA